MAILANANQLPMIIFQDNTYTNSDFSLCSRLSNSICQYAVLFLPSSGQTKQIFGRNTETETRLPGKAEISAETEILAETLFSAETVYFGRNSLFRPKCFVSARTIYGFTPDFLPKSGPKHGFLAKRDYTLFWP